MSDIKKGSLIDDTNLGQFLDEPLSIIKSVFSSFFEGDEFDGQSNFMAVVISNPVSIEALEYRALGYQNFDSKMNKSYKKFKVRITHKKQNPHAILQDPCDITKAADLCEQYALISAHTTIVTSQMAGINIGALVEIHLDKNSNGTYNLQTGHLVRVLHPKQTSSEVLTAASCDSIKTFFINGENYVPPPAIELSSDLRALAQAYDKNEDIPGKYRTSLTFGNGDPVMPHMHHLSDFPQGFKKPFDTFVKAMLQAAFEQGYGEVAITSGTRDPEKQERLHQQWLRKERDLPASCGYCANASKHVLGLALDINFYDRSGNFISSGMLKNEWLQTELPQLFQGAPFFMKWGGEFDNYDPVHFQLNPTNWGTNAEQIMKQLGESNINLDTKTTGEFTEQEMEGFDKRRGQNKEDVEANNQAPSAIAAAASESG